MIKVILNGAAGRMGKEVERCLLNDNNFELVARVDTIGAEANCLASLDEYQDSADLIIDFSHHSATKSLLEYAMNRNIPVLIATTGQTDEEKALIDDASQKIAVFHSANMSIGVALLCNLAKKAAATMVDADIEIVETHHNRKTDAPSGTALMIANALKTIRTNAKLIIGRNGGKREKEDIGISSVRMGNIVGIHEIMISTDNETLTLKHEAHSRSLFADGAIVAAKFLAGKPAGIYCMNDMVK